MTRIVFTFKFSQKAKIIYITNKAQTKQVRKAKTRLGYFNVTTIDCIELN